MNTYDTAILAAIVTTLAEMPEDYVGREGLLYAPFMDRDLGTFQATIATAESAGLIQRKPNHGIVITDRGREVAAKIEARLGR